MFRQRESVASISGALASFPGNWNRQFDSSGQGSRGERNATTIPLDGDGDRTGNWTNIQIAPDGTIQSQQYTAGRLSTLLSSVFCLPVFCLLRGIGNRLTATNQTGAATNYFADTLATTPGGNALNQYAKINYPGTTSIQPVHDTDGNRTSGPVPGEDGLNPGVPVPSNATLKWDAENRLVKAEVNSITVDYDYDHQSRLVARTEGTVTTRYLYDGWNRIAEYQETTTGHDLKVTYLWGMDMSGSMQGAGGVGGLLAIRYPAPVNDSTYFYPTYDGNGNVSEYVNDSGDEVAHFEYDPFGNLTVDSESNAEEFPYRFSTKPQDLTTGLYYYGYRWFDPITGRWPSRDPIDEEGGINLYGFVNNRPTNHFDVLGLVEVIGGVPSLKDVPVVWANKPRNQNPGLAYGGAVVFCICDDEPKVVCYLKITLFITLNAGATLRERDAAGNPETWRRVFGHEAMHAREFIKQYNLVLDRLKAESGDPPTEKTAKALQEKYVAEFNEATNKGGLHDDTKNGNPSDPRPRSGVGYEPPAGSPELPPNPFSNE